MGLGVEGEAELIIAMTSNGALVWEASPGNTWKCTHSEDVEMVGRMGMYACDWSCMYNVLVCMLWLYYKKAGESYEDQWGMCFELKVDDMIVLPTNMYSPVIFKRVPTMQFWPCPST